MGNVVSKKNMTIAIREYTDNNGQQKKVWKTIGELVTWDDGSQTFETWGPTGSVRGNVFEQDNNQQPQNQGGFQQNNQGGFQPQGNQQNNQGGFQQNQGGHRQN